MCTIPSQLQAKLDIVIRLHPRLDTLIVFLREYLEKDCHLLIIFVNSLDPDQD